MEKAKPKSATALVRGDPKEEGGLIGTEEAIKKKGREGKEKKTGCNRLRPCQSIYHSTR